MDFDTTIDIDTQVLLLAASNHDISKLKTLLESMSVTVQDSESGFTALHSAIAACESEDADNHVNGANGHTITDDDAVDLNLAADTVRLLIEHGALWDAIDANDETPGSMALRLGLEEIYQIIVDAGVREIRQSHQMDEYSALPDDSDEELKLPANMGQPDAAECSNDFAMIGPNINWVSHAKQIVSDDGPNILIMGYCVDLFESVWQEYSPRTYHIVESRPEMIAQMKADLDEKPGVIILKGSDHDALTELAREQFAFDTIFHDTLTLSQYRRLKEFISEWADQILGSKGRIVFPHVFGMERQDLYDAYTKVSSLCCGL
jgi:protein arginine N-methyltransferase 2